MQEYVTFSHLLLISNLSLLSLFMQNVTSCVLSAWEDAQIIAPHVKQVSHSMPPPRRALVVVPMENSGMRTRATVSSAQLRALSAQRRRTLAQLV